MFTFNRLPTNKRHDVGIISYNSNLFTLITDYILNISVRFTFWMRKGGASEAPVVISSLGLHPAHLCIGDNKHLLLQPHAD